MENCDICLVIFLCIIFISLFLYTILHNYPIVLDYNKKYMKNYYEPLKNLPITNINSTINYINPKKICIFMVATPEINEYAKYTIKINKQYCEKYNFDFKLIDSNLTPDLSINFSKIQATLDLMKHKYQYIIHIDADAFIYNDNYDIRHIINTYMYWPISFIASEDCYNKKICSKPGKINSGVYIVKNDIIGKKIMQSWLYNSRNDCKKEAKQFPSCQLVFSICVYKKWFPFIKIIPYNVMNGIDGLFIKHYMSQTNRERIDQLKKTRIVSNNERQQVYT